MTDKEFIQHYAEKLRTASNFKLLVIKYLLQEIRYQHYSWIKGSTMREHQTVIHLSCDVVIASANLEKLIEQDLADENLWRQKAQWILSRLEAWEKGEKNLEELKFIFCLPTGSLPKDSTAEDQLIAICAVSTSWEFVQKLRILELSREDLENILGINPPINLTLVPEPPLYEDCDWEAFPTSAPFSTWLRAVPYPHKWQESGSHHRQFSQRRFVKIQIAGTHLRTGRETLLSGSPAWDVINSLDWKILQLNLILCMYAVRAQGHPFVVKGTDIVKKLYGRRTDLDINLKLTYLKSRLELLRTLAFQFKWYGGANNSQKLKCEFAGEGAGVNELLMWVISAIRYQTLPEKELFIEITPGQAFSLFCGQDSQTSHQISYLPKEMIELDSYKYWIELAIGLYIIIDYRIRRNKHHRIETIIRETLSPDDLEAALNNPSQGSRLKKRILKCFDFYQSINWTVTLEFPNGGFSDFLKGTVDIIPCSPISESPSHLKRPTQPKLETPPLQPAPKDNDLGDWLLKARTEKKWSIGQLAQYSGVDKSVISRIERGQRNATPETIAKLRQALELGSSNSDH
ncbi:MAG TPA: helix-turn-helix transcriptional regulator [Allocoleopsis sp.]